VGYAEKRNGYFLARFSDGRGKWPAVKDEHRRAIRYHTKREAERAADDEEAKVRGGQWKDPSAGQQLTFGEWANAWYAKQDLAPSSMQNLRHHLEEHLLPEFEAVALADVFPADVDDWERKERDAGYEVSSVKTWRGTLTTILGDAVDGREVARILGGAARRGGLIDFNPALKRRGRGKRAGRKKNRGPEKVTTDDLGALLLAERCALLSRRDDEFVAVIVAYNTGMRWGELVGLETEFVRLGSIRIEWQLWEDDAGVFHRLTPKEDSYRDICVPDWLSKLVSDHITRTAPRPCPCHGHKYVFRGLGGAPRRTPATRRRVAGVADVAKLAELSVATVSNVLNRPERVAEATRTRVEAAMTRLGFVPDYEPVARKAADGAHWRRNGFATWIFKPAAEGCFPPKAPQPRRPVPVTAEPFPGLPIRGRGAQSRTEASWQPIAMGLTPHGLRHSHKSTMAELHTHEVLSHERMGHELGGIGGRYNHVTEAMQAELCEQLTQRWLAALDARAALSPRSPVRVLDELLAARQRKVGRNQDHPIEFPQKGETLLRARPRKRA
jgi:integrase